MRIQHNIMAMNAYRNYNTNTSALSKNLEKLSSGYKINRAGDDAAGLAISEKMRAQITGLNAASKNVKDGISLVKTAEGAMQEIQDMLNRMDYLATQSANGTYDNDVDRKNLQKEVDQLRSEINRIADSANFNGIKLLDGKAGVNTTGFTSFENVAGVVGHNGSVSISGLLAASNAGSPNVHLEGAAATQVNAEATIDFSGLNITAEYTTSSVTASIDLGGTAFTVTLTGKTAYSAADIATALKAAVQGTTYGVKTADGTNDTATSTNNDGIRIGNNVYKWGTADATGIKLTLAGVADDANATPTNYKALATTNPTAATNEFDSDKADEINADLGFTVTVSGLKGATGSSGDAVHMTTQVKQAVAHVDASLAGINMQLDNTVVQQDYKLNIDGKEFTFELNDAANTAAGVINLAAEKAAGATDEELIHAAVDKLSQQAQFTGGDGRTWKIGVGADDTIHIEQTGASATGKEIKGYTDLTSKISVTGPATNDKGAGVKIGVDAANIAVGNKLTFTLGGNTVELEVVESGANASKHQINKADITDPTKWESALGSGYTAELTTGTGADAGKQFITVRSKLTTQADPDSVAASKTPVVTGSGLVLQIGDTSESYNQLSVEIGDMHTAALGIDSLTIANPEGASAAIQTIRDAINQVSSVRGDLGATQNRLEHTANNLSVMAENIQDAESTIRDTDVAEEMMAYTKNNILIQSAQAMLAQANAVPQGVLQLLG